MSEVSVSLSFLLNQPTKCPDKLLMRRLRPTLPLPHGRDKRRIFAFSVAGLRPLCMIRVVPRTFCQASIIIIHTCNRKDEGRLIYGARSCSGGFADRSSERRYRGLPMRRPMLESE